MFALINLPVEFDERVVVMRCDTGTGKTQTLAEQTAPSRTGRPRITISPRVAISRDVARRYGHVSAEKADDMRRQQTSSHDANRRFAVITDSAADIPDEDMERLDIHMVPCRVQFGDRGYLDKVSITSNEFFAELEANPSHPTTSQPSPGDFRRQFQFLASHFPDVVSINLTAVASGTYEAALSAADRTNAPGRLHVINSRNASLGQGLLVVFAAECAHAGLSIEKTLAAITPNWSGNHSQRRS